MLSWKTISIYSQPENVNNFCIQLNVPGFSFRSPKFAFPFRFTRIHIRVPLISCTMKRKKLRGSPSLISDHGNLESYIYCCQNTSPFKSETHHSNMIKCRSSSTCNNNEVQNYSCKQCRSPHNYA